MGNRAKYRKSAELLVKGTELVLPDGNVMFLKVLNDFEVAEARRAAQAARGLYTIAVKTNGSDEYAAVQAAFLARPRDMIIGELLESKSSGFFMEATQAIEIDPEWRERLEILRRGDELESRPEGDPEREAFTQINADWIAEVTRRQQDEMDYQRGVFERMSAEELKDAYCNEWLERRANTVGLESYNVTEVLLGARCCEAQPDDEGNFAEDAHSGCNHREQIYETTKEVREDGELYVLIRAKYDEISMSVRDAKN